MSKTNLFWQVYMNLENEVIELSKYIFFTDTTTKINKDTNTIENIDNEN